MSKRVIISGGGTGGHVFPAIAIANALKTIDSDVKIHFVGALGRLEMVKVPEAGYEISGLPVAGFERRLSLKNIAVVVRLLKSLLKARKIISSFKPDLAVGVGGYASGPILKMAGRKGIPSLIQEQNSYAGLTNKLLARKAKVICVAYEGMEKYFPAGKIRLTGNPVRKDIVSLEGKRTGALEYFKLLEEIPVVLVLGGSGGSRTLNESLAAGLEKLLGERIQVIWQTGSLYYDDIIKSHNELEGSMIHVHAFIDRMDLAFAAADIVVSRAGAGTISELTMVGKPLILIPSAHVAGDHQAKNAMALVQRKAALMLNDRDAVNMLAGTIIELINDKEKCRELSENISSMAIKDSDILIAKEILKLIND
ncbi:MAG TPA: undecaprenyldiphospho-muramoylpentapeptide beta-N-acetylglucosaminyltransferase [Desulfobacteraceae bacterium]|nr:undecaprenyldiphospho-muramoylpentapeptide beta-N-acetylglucosaminyltransferase [Desulfobacteraceae bacterium]